MSATLEQIYVLNPSTTIGNADLFYLVQSPYTPGTDSGISGADLKASFLQPSNNLSDLASIPTARTNLGLTVIAIASPPLSSILRGTGVNNGGSTIPVGVHFAMSGAFGFTGTLTGLTAVTFPTSGTLATTSQLPVPAALTRVDDTNVTLTLGGTPATALLQAVSLTLGWTGTLSGTRGGTGVNNGASTITIGGSVSLIGAFTFSGTLSGNTAVTFPTSGTLATTSQLPTPSALTRVDDTNVTLTLGGSPTVALLAATSLTLGWTGTLSGTRGGTGVNNGSSLITIGGNVTFSGAFPFTGTLTGSTSVTFPTSGTLATTAQIPTGAALTKTDDTNVTLTLGGSPSTALVNAASLTLGWTGTLSGTRGGTGVNNGSSLITIGGSVTFSGAFTFTGTLTANTSVTFPTSGTLLTTASINTYEAEGRLTLTTNVPVTTADVTAATTVYYTPYIGDHISLFDGSSTWTTITFTQISIAVPATTNTMYDAYVYNNAGTATLELTAWTNDTTRATALTYQNGVLVKTGATTRRYVGSFRTTGSSGQTEDSLVKRYLWNYYNRVTKPMKAVDATDTWNYSTATFRQANASAANQLDMVIGVSEDMVHAQVAGRAVNSTASNRLIAVGIGLDSTTTNSAGIRDTGTSASVTVLGTPKAIYDDYPGAGRHTLVWLEIGAGTDTQTWQGDNASGTTTQFGIIGFLRG